MSSLYIWSRIPLNKRQIYRHSTIREPQCTIPDKEHISSYFSLKKKPSHCLQTAIFLEGSTAFLQGSSLPATCTYNLNQGYGILFEEVQPWVSFSFRGYHCVVCVQIERVVHVYLFSGYPGPLVFLLKTCLFFLVWGGGLLRIFFLSGFFVLLLTM